MKRLIFVVAAMLLLAEASPDACSCAMRRPCQALWEADLVFVGRAAQVTVLGPGNLETKFVIEEWLRGDRVGPTVSLFAHGLGGSCDIGFEQGVRYLVYAEKRQNGWGALMCGGSASLEDSSSALKYIRHALSREGEGTVSGEAFEIRQPYSPLEVTRFADLVVTLRSDTRELTAITDRNGAYKFDRVPAGEYTISIDLSSRGTSLPSKRIAIGTGACLRHRFGLPRERPQ